VVVVGGDDEQVGACLRPAAGLALVAEDEDVNVEELCHFVERFLAVLSAPDEQVSRARLERVFDCELSIEDFLVEGIDAAVGGEGVRKPDSVRAFDGERLGEEEIGHSGFDGVAVCLEFSIDGADHRAVHFLAVFDDLSVVDEGGVVVCHDEVDAVWEIDFEAEGIEEQLVGEAVSFFIDWSAVDDFLE